MMNSRSKENVQSLKLRVSEAVGQGGFGTRIVQGVPPIKFYKALIALFSSDAKWVS